MGEEKFKEPAREKELSTKPYVNNLMTGIMVVFSESLL